jgi:quercetin dioxygenase-like cupin family protein
MDRTGLQGPARAKRARLQEHLGSWPVTAVLSAILSHTLYNDEQAKIIVFGFAAGEELTAHTAPMPATIQILSGEGRRSV